MATFHGIELAGSVKSAMFDDTCGDRFMGFVYHLPLGVDAGVYLPVSNDSCNRPIAFVDGITWELDDPMQRSELAMLLTGLLDQLAQLGHLGCLQNNEGA